MGNEFVDLENRNFMYESTHRLKISSLDFSYAYMNLLLVFLPFVNYLVDQMRSSTNEFLFVE